MQLIVLNSHRPPSNGVACFCAVGHGLKMRCGVMYQQFQGRVLLFTRNYFKFSVILFFYYLKSKKYFNSCIHYYTSYKINKGVKWNVPWIVWVSGDRVSLVRQSACEASKCITWIPRDIILLSKNAYKKWMMCHWGRNREYVPERKRIIAVLVQRAPALVFSQITAWPQWYLRRDSNRVLESYVTSYYVLLDLCVLKKPETQK